MEERKQEILKLKRRGTWMIILGLLFLIFGFTLVFGISDGKLVYHLDSGRNIILAIFDFLVGFVLIYLYRKNKIQIKVQEELNRMEAGKVSKKQLINKINYCLTLKSIKNSDFVLDKLKAVKKLINSDKEISDENLLFLNQNLNKLKTIKAKQVSPQQMNAITEICNNLDKIVKED